MSVTTFTYEGTRFVAYPQSGSFFGVTQWKGRPWLQAIPMNVDGTPAFDGHCDVTNMHEDGDDKLLETINADFGTAFVQDDFAGR